METFDAPVEFWMDRDGRIQVWVRLPPPIGDVCLDCTSAKLMVNEILNVRDQFMATFGITPEEAFGPLANAPVGAEGW